MHLIRFIRAKLFQYRVQTLGSGTYRDRFGLKYTLWPDTKPFDTVIKGARLDDLGLAFVLEDLFAQLLPEAGVDNPVVCVDVGAFIGIVSMFMASRVGGKGVVHSFEPSPEIFRRIKHNVEQGGHDNVTVNNLAVSDQSAQDILFDSSGTPGGHHIVHDAAASGQDNLTRISTVTLDSYLESHGLSKVHVLKIDAEGSDDKVLAGAAKALAERRISFIIGEYETGDMYTGIIAKLKELGYGCYYVLRHTNRLLRDAADYPAGHPSLLNFLAIAPGIDTTRLNIS